MPIPHTVTEYLSSKNVSYEVRRHPHSGSSMQSATSAGVPASNLAKGVVFKDDSGFLLAVLPAVYDVDVNRLQDELEQDLCMVEESELGELFPDCEVGAVPAIGPAYGLRSVVDGRLCGLKDVYFESGDHEDLIHITEPDFLLLLEGSSFINFSREYL